jgi:DNA-binding CsgD family transcriptional regulator
MQPRPAGVIAREREIIQLLTEGQSNKAAAATLGISVKIDRSPPRKHHEKAASSHRE